MKISLSSNVIKSIVVHALVSWLRERLENMKKYIAFIVLSLFAAPVFAACSIEEAVCTAGSSLINPPTIHDKYIPDNLQNLQKPDAFMPKYHTPYYDMLINTAEPSATGGAAPNYNSNCQFGVCLPDMVPGEGPVEY